MNEKNNSARDAGLPAAQTVNIAAVRLHEFEGEPRVRDSDLGKRLGLQRPRALRQTIERNRVELEAFGPLATQRGTSRGQQFDEYWLSEEQALLVSTMSDAPDSAAVRHMLIKVFVAWRRGHLTAASTVALAPDVLEMIRRDEGISRMLAHKVTGIEAMVAAINNAMVDMVARMAPYAPTSIVRHGMTAGQIWRVHGFPPLRSTAWFGNRLSEMGCAVYGRGRGELGDHSARLYDPDKAAEWLKTGGGRALVEGYVKERLGQGKLEGV